MIALLSIGLVMVNSASISVALYHSNNEMSIGKARMTHQKGNINENIKEHTPLESYLHIHTQN